IRMNDRSNPVRTTWVLVLLLLDPQGTARAQDRPAANPDIPGLSKVRRFQATAISPDGKRIAWVEMLRARDDATSQPSAIFIAALGAGPGSARRVSSDEEPCTEHSPTWSPDGEYLAFLSNRGTKEQLQVHVAPAAGGGAKRLTNLKGFLADPRWSPDGKQL